ncbi:MAG TPA: YceI family protein [Steroidobacteraceae bacterium]
MSKSLAVAVLALSVAACAAPRPRPTVPPPLAQTAEALQLLPAAGTYKIDSNNSELRILVYRAGPLASFGHNHVIVSHAVVGLVQIGNDISDSSFSLSVPVESFVIDDAQSRLEEGSDFSGDVAEDAKSGTRRNMLGSAMLNAAEFAEIDVKSVALAGTPGAVTADLTLSIAGRESTISAPFSLQGDAHQLTATGSMQLQQTAIGLTPYSLLHGALQVQDAMLLKFKIAVPIEKEPAD